MVINKPAGLLSQGTPDPKREHVLSVMKKDFPVQEFFLHHRLDKDTSGVLLLGKSTRANAPLTEIFRTPGPENLLGDQLDSPRASRKKLCRSKSFGSGLRPKKSARKK